MRASPPQEAAVPAALNLLLAAVLVAANFFLLLGMPALLAGTNRLLVLPGFVLLVLATVPHWATLHEAIHGRLLPRPKANEALGRLLAILLGAPYAVLRFGHLSHHALNARAAERPEFFDPTRRSWLVAALVYYPRLLFGLYAVEVLSGPLSLLPRRALRPIVRRLFYEGDPGAAGMADRAERQLLASRRLRQIRLDALTIVALVLVGLWLYGPAWPWLAGAFLGRAFLVSFMDNAPHYEGPLADPDQGYDMRLPAPLGTLVLCSNLHGTHHRHPSLPWTALKAQLERDGAPLNGSYLVRPWRQLRGPIPLAGTDPERA